MSPMKKMVVALTLAVLVVAPSVRSKDRLLSVKPGNVAIAVFRANGQPVGALAMELQSIDGKSLLSASTDEVGLATLKIDDSGIYRLAVGGNMTLPLEVSAAAESTTLRVVLPVAYSAGMAAEGAAPVFISLGAAATSAASIWFAGHGDPDTGEDFVKGILGMINPQDLKKLTPGELAKLRRDIANQSPISP